MSTVGIRVKVRFYKKKSPTKGEWEQVVLYVRAEDKEKLKQFDRQEITLYLSEGADKKQELLNALLDLFIAAYSKTELKKELNSLPQAKKVLELLGGA